MKKFFLLFMVLISLATVSAYIFIPRKIKIGAIAKNSMNIKPAYRYLVNTENWPKWWPGATPFHHSSMVFKITKTTLSGFEIRLFYKKDSLPTVLQIIPLEVDSTAYTWSCEMESSKNPFKRWLQYFGAIKIKRSFEVLTDHLKNHLDKEENIYGFTVQRVKVTDSVLISTRTIFDHYPHTEEIGIMVEKLKDYITKEKAFAKNYPMLNIHQSGTDTYEAMVAIATDRLLTSTPDFSPKLVLKGGNILEAEIRGGPSVIQEGFEEFQNYKREKGFESPAIPYQLMITDRVKEKDTLKWITKFYYPVF